MKLGSNDISTVKLGTSQVQAIYQGANLVWQNAPVATAATGVGQTSFTANWNAYTGATYYLLDVSESSNFSTFVYENQITTSTSYVVIGLNPNTTYYYRVRASTAYDTDAQAFFDRVDTAGGALSTTEQTAVNTLVLQMKADGIWSSMKAIYPMVGASSAACAQNLKSSSFTGTFSTGWTYASTGVKPNGTSAYMDTTLLSNDFTDGKGGFTCYTRTTDTSGSALEYGSIDSHWIISWMSEARFAIMGSSYSSFSNITSSYVGSVVNQRSSSTETKINYDGGSEVQSSSITSLGSTLSVYLGAWHYSGGAQYFGSREIAFFAKHDYLDNTESQDLIDAVQAFQTTLSRNV